MSAVNAVPRTERIIAAAQESGQRAILASGWSDLDHYPFPEQIFPLKVVPHDWLLPQVAAAIHHGGAGTTAAEIRAGKPSIICPLVGDQPFWGRRVYELGVGPRPIPQRQVTAGNLAAAITQTLQDRAMQERTAALGQRIAAEDGVARAVRVIQAIFQGQPSDHWPLPAPRGA
jgi:sterol 3beta-glucosyltransferase